MRTHDGTGAQKRKTEVFALDYEGMARILCDTLNSDDDEYDNNTELAERISAYLNECGLDRRPLYASAVAESR